jgi:hypothetical protein
MARSILVREAARSADGNLPPIRPEILVTRSDVVFPPYEFAGRRGPRMSRLANNCVNKDRRKSSAPIRTTQGDLATASEVQ